MGALLSLFRRKQPREPVAKCLPCKNAFSNNFRGILATILCIVMLAICVDNVHREKTKLAIAYTTDICMIFSPVPVGACALIPVFLSPLFGVFSSNDCCAALINEHIVFYFVGGWCLMLLNNCGMDKRLVCKLLACGSEGAFTMRKLLCKSCFAAFFASALSNRELSTEVVMNYIVKALEPLQTVKAEANYVEVKKIMCNAVAISSVIGSLCILHAAVTTIQMRCLFSEIGGPIFEAYDLFNFLKYSAFAVPMALCMFMLNLLFHSIYLSKFGQDKKATKYSQDLIRRALLKNKNDLGPTSWHEKVSTLFLVILLICYFTRWSKWLNMGWGQFRQYAEVPDLCKLKDATTAAIFAFALHFLPKSLNFLKIFSVKKQRDKPPMKVESGILFWKFIDKNTDYSLFIAFGAGIILYSIMFTDIHVVEKLNDSFGTQLTGMNWNVGIFMVVFQAVFVANLTSCVAAEAITMPFFLTVAFYGQGKWPARMHLVALAVGIGSALGFCFPSRNSPLKYVRTIGKVEMKKQIVYSILSVVVCAIILWLFLCFFAPVVWNLNEDLGAMAVMNFRPGAPLPEMPGKDDAAAAAPELEEQKTVEQKEEPEDPPGTG